MKITILDRTDDEEDEIIVKCRGLDESLLALISSFKTGKSKMTFNKGTQIVVLDLKDIYYFESVEDRTFAYTKDDVFETKQRIYQLEEELSSKDFFRASKAVILNVNKISSLSSAFGGRFEALLKNGCKIIISRMYVPVLRNILGI